MAFLIVGLGSMGRRRARNLASLGETEVFGLDINPARERQFKEEFNLPIWPHKDSVDARIEAVFICTPPNVHASLIERYSENHPVFVEASVSEIEDLRRFLEFGRDRVARVFPSLTMNYFEFVEHLLEALELVGYPRIVSYHVGHHIDDWHPWESPRDYYVSNQETGACRELIPFELGWMTKVFGEFVPSSVQASTNWVDYQIESSYGILGTFMEHGTLANLQFEVLSRPGPTRELRVVGERGLISYSGDSHSLVVRVVGEEPREQILKSTGKGIGVNPDRPYELEVSDFLCAIRTGNRQAFPNTLEEDIGVLKILEAVDALK